VTDGKGMGSGAIIRGKHQTMELAGGERDWE
jgi:hypothetical protein